LKNTSLYPSPLQLEGRIRVSLNVICGIYNMEQGKGKKERNLKQRKEERKENVKGKWKVER
jgi:hypothetical protein